MREWRAPVTREWYGMFKNGSLNLEKLATTEPVVQQSDRFGAAHRPDPQEHWVARPESLVTLNPTPILKSQVIMEVRKD
jgi:hypothetical protein